MLAYGGAQWEEKTYVIGESEWRESKQSVMEFCDLPYIIDGDYKLSETFAVHNYIAQKFSPSLIGDTPQERARIMMIHRIGEAALVDFAKCCFKGEMTRTEVVEKLL